MAAPKKPQRGGRHERKLFHDCSLLDNSHNLSLSAEHGRLYWLCLSIDGNIVHN